MTRPPPAAHVEYFQVISFPQDLSHGTDLLRAVAADVEGAEGNSNGFGIEFYVETPADEIAAEVGAMIGSWQFQVVYQISQLAAREILLQPRRLP